MKQEWATDAWFKTILDMANQQTGGAPRPELSYVAQYVVTDTPRGTVKFYEELKSGRMARMAQGEDPHPDVTITLVYSDYQKIFTELKSSHELASYHVEGDVGRLDGAMALRQTEGYKAYKRKILEVTSWP